MLIASDYFVFYTVKHLKWLEHLTKNVLQVL